MKFKIKSLYLTVLSGIILLMSSLTAFADTPEVTSIEGSKIFKGAKNMFTDATNALMIISPIATVLLCAYFLTRKGAADEMDQKKWHTRFLLALLCGMGATLASVFVGVFQYYFK